MALRSRKDSAEARDASPCPKRTESTPRTENESCVSTDPKNIKNSLKLSEPSEESSNSCSSRESDSPECVEISDQMSEQIKPSTFEETDATSLDGCQQNDKIVLSECEMGHSPLSMEEDEPESGVRSLE